MSFKDRDRYKTFDDALKQTKSMCGWIHHILFNEDQKDFSIMAHINCEWCLYCEQRNIAYKNGLRYENDYPLVHLAVENPYPEELK